MFILLFIAWYLIGMSGFIYNWTKEFDFTSSEILICLMTGLLGPIAYPLGFLIHAEEKVLVKQRNK